MGGGTSPSGLAPPVGDVSPCVGEFLVPPLVRNTFGEYISSGKGFEKEIQRFSLRQRR